MFVSHVPLWLLTVSLVAYALRATWSLRKGRRQDLRWLTIGVIGGVLVNVGPTMLPATPDLMFASIAGFLRFSTALFLSLTGYLFVLAFALFMPRL